MPSRDEVTKATSEMAAWAAAGAATGGLVGAGWGAVAPLIQRLVANFAAHSWEELAGYASDDKPFEDVVERLTATPEGQELLLRALDAARWTSLDEKLRALGRTLAAAADDHARIDKEASFVDAVHAVSGQHIRVLSILAKKHDDIVSESVGDEPLMDWEIRRPEFQYSVVDLCMSCPELGLPVVVEPLVNRLVSVGLVNIVGFHPAPSLTGHESPRAALEAFFGITAMGHSLLIRAAERSI